MAKIMLKQLAFRGLDRAGLNALFRVKNRGKIKVLLYHNITPKAAHFDNAISPEDFSRQISYLKRHYNIIGIDHDGGWQGLVKDKVNILISFDDGFRNNLTHALPVLLQHNVTAIFFLINDCIEQGAAPGFIRERLGEGASAPHFATLNQDDAQTMIGAGMTIGCHSLEHTDHAGLDTQDMLDQSSRARAQLEQRFGREIANFAFPWGKHRSGQELAMLDVFERVFLTKHGFAMPQDRIIPRNEVTTLAHLKAAASGALDALRIGRG